MNDIINLALPFLILIRFTKFIINLKKVIDNEIIKVHLGQYLNCNHKSEQMFQGGDLKDQMLKSYIDQIFDKYDADKSGTLDQQQMTKFFNDLFKSLGINVTVNEQQALEAIKSIDVNYDGTVNKAQLFTAFRAMINTPPPPPQPVHPTFPNYGGYQPYGGGYGGYQQPYYGGQYQQPGYPNYMNQSTPYMNNTYNQNYPQTGYNGYMGQSNTNYMNQSYQPGPNSQPFNPYNNFKK